MYTQPCAATMCSNDKMCIVQETADGDAAEEEGTMAESAMVSRDAFTSCMYMQQLSLDLNCS